MQIPDAFYDFCLLLHQDSFDLYGREDQDLAAGPLRYMSKEQKIALRTFLDHLLTGNYSDEELQEIYCRGDADIGFRSGLRYFFRLVRDTIDRGT
jgi:hypothetical protein